MGTNYYLLQDTCPCCHQPKERKHIGKASGGWCFALHVYPDEGIHDLEAWKLLWRGEALRDEYDRQVTEEFMLNVITERWGYQYNWDQPPYGYDSWQQFHDHNCSEFGPDGLIRSRIDDAHCISHGAGTWDSMVGEFS